MPTWLTTLLPIIIQLIEWIISEYEAAYGVGASASPAYQGLKSAQLGLQAALSELNRSKP